MKLLIVYAYYETPDARRNLSFFLRHGVVPDSNRQHVIVINGTCTIEDQIPKFENVKVLKRPNVGFDFGAWSHAFRHFQLDQFDYFFLLNSSVTGPFMPSYRDSSDWPNPFVAMLNDKVKLAGITIDGNNSNVFVHSMFLVTDKVGIDLLVRNGIFTNNDQDVSKDDVVYGREVRASQIILNNGFLLDCLAMPHSKRSTQQLIKSSFGNLWIPGTYYDDYTIEPLDVVFFKTNRGCSPLALERSMRLADRKERKVYMSDEQKTVRDFHKLYYDQHHRTWFNTFWLGVSVQKNPLDLWIYQEMIHSLKPDLIVECGTYDGGSALFLASICDLVGRGKVMTIDIAPRPGRPTHPRIQYVAGSSTAESTVALVKSTARSAAVVLVILDSDHSQKHVFNELNCYADVVTRGSYLIVEDGNINGNPVLPEFGPGPTEAITQFLSQRKDFVVDESREKFFMTFNPRGYLKKS